jgi:hypothetical protein
MTHIPHFWAPTRVRELDTTPLQDRKPARIVACLNVWNDLGALQATAGTWMPYVDAIIAVDGAYGAIDQGLSTDGTREFFRGLKKPVTLLDGAGLDQCAKRTMYLHAGQPGDLLFIVDADEAVVGGHVLRGVGLCDVGWVRIHSNLYRRQYGQPRLIRWMEGLHYQGRHHWIYHHDRVLCTHQYGGPGYEHRVINIAMNNQRQLGRSSARIAAKKQIQTVQHAREVSQCSMPSAEMSDAKIGARESLQILMVAYRDDGLAPSRLHTAINRTTPHASLFFKKRPGPFGVPDGYLVRHGTHQLSQAAASADVQHFHGTISMEQSLRRNVPTVFHHHGTLYRTNADEYNAQARNCGALVLVSNLELLSWADDLDAYFLPNAMPVARYRQLRTTFWKPWTGNTPFRVAHSPSRPERKGTNEFLAACARLAKRGIPVEPVMLHGFTHANVLKAKATCHAAFDSFWLGMQCSGLEAAAMGLPVIAGDETVANRYIEHFGACPYTFANDLEQLESALERLVSDATFRADETSRVSQYVVQHHDESAVALRYLDLLDMAFGWRSQPIRRPHMIRRTGVTV